MALPNLISLGGVELTDQGRTYDSQLEERMVQNELAVGSLRRYSKARKNKFNINWTWVPNLATQTYDKLGGRDAIRTLALSGASQTLVVRDPQGSTTIYTVFIESYTEKLMRRDVTLGINFFEISLGLVEV